LPSPKPPTLTAHSPHHHHLPAQTHSTILPQHPLPPSSALPHQTNPALPHLSFVSLPSPRTIQIQRTTAVRQGASWTAESHLQPTVAAVARPSMAAWCPSEPMLLSCPGCCPPRRRLPGGASSRHPASDIVAEVGTADTTAMAGGCPVGVQHAVSTHPGVVVRGPVSSRPVPGHLGRRRGPAVRTAGVHPSSVQPSGVQPSGVHPSGVQPSGVQPSGVHPVGPDASVSSHLRPWR
jgi:hypothetical protein